MLHTLIPNRCLLQLFCSLLLAFQPQPHLAHGTAERRSIGTGRRLAGIRNNTNSPRNRPQTAPSAAAEHHLVSAGPLRPAAPRGRGDTQPRSAARWVRGLRLPGASLRCEERLAGTSCCLFRHPGRKGWVCFSRMQGVRACIWDCTGVYPCIEVLGWKVKCRDAVAQGKETEGKYNINSSKGTCSQHCPAREMASFPIFSPVLMHLPHSCKPMCAAAPAQHGAHMVHSPSSTCIRIQHALLNSTTALPSLEPWLCVCMAGKAGHRVPDQCPE